MDDDVEDLARLLYVAFHLDTPNEGAVWPPSRKSSHQAWRRVAAASIDRGARP